MKILFFTTHRHLYSNFMLAELCRRGAFLGHEVRVVSRVVWFPEMNLSIGLEKYLKISGFFFVWKGIVKEFLATLARIFSRLRKDQNSFFYPFESLDSSISCSGIRFWNHKKADGEIKAFQPDVLVVLNLGSKLPVSAGTVPLQGSYGFHPSLLPDYRGLSSAFWALTNREAVHGATLYRLSGEADGSSNVLTKSFHTKNIDNEHELLLQCSLAGAEMLAEILENLACGERVGSNYPMSVAQNRYFSLPSKRAVKRFLKGGLKFYRIKDFFWS